MKNKNIQQIDSIHNINHRSVSPTASIFSIFKIVYYLYCTIFSSYLIDFPSEKHVKEYYMYMLNKFAIIFML